MNERRDVTPEEQRGAVTTAATAGDQRAADVMADNEAQRIAVQRGDTTPAQTPPASARAPQDEVQLLPRDRRDEFRTRWEQVQVMFVDQPRDAVQQAHDLVDQVVDRLTEGFTQQREGLMGSWARGEDVSTEDLRLALQRYRAFFDRLLSA